MPWTRRLVLQNTIKISTRLSSYFDRTNVSDLLDLIYADARGHSQFSVWVTRHQLLESLEINHAKLNTLLSDGSHEDCMKSLRIC
jgi:hypothetical protein